FAIPFLLRLLCSSFAVRPLPVSPLFPYTTLFRSRVALPQVEDHLETGFADPEGRLHRDAVTARGGGEQLWWRPQLAEEYARSEKDRKSTRLNSSHVSISYAVFCLKKKKKTDLNVQTSIKRSIGEFILTDSVLE